MSRAAKRCPLMTFSPSKDKALLRFGEVCALEEANKADLKILREWLARKHGGHCFLKGYEADIWNEDHEKDLVSVTAPSRNKDALSHWVDLYILPIYHRVLGRRFKVNTNVSHRSPSLEPARASYLTALVGP
jgi:hypothetical protein